MNLLRLILFPFSLLYGLITYFRNKLFDWHILPSKSFPLPVISVGNLSVGGTGKSPHVEYLIRLLQKDYDIATLSRGYKRKSKGFVLADENSTVNELGDEPLQFYTKFKNIKVAVDEKRKRGISKLILQTPETQVVLLDDAHQHRYVKPGLSILLTDFHRPYSQDYPLPTGNLREFRGGAKRADIIIVTKTSKVLSPITRQRMLEEIKPLPHQKLFFSYIEHGNYTPLSGIDFVPEKKKKYYSILLVAGIANTYPLEFYLKNFCEELEILKFQDHHQYTTKDITHIIETFDNIVTGNKIIVTTEKDAMRLAEMSLIRKLVRYPICYIPIEIKFHGNDKKDFDKKILDYVGKNSGNRSVHQE